MVAELLVRFLMGGVVVCAFAVMGDVLRPKTFAGIFGAAPSVALATLGLTFALKGGSYVGIEGRSMLAGALAFLCYSLATGMLLLRLRTNALVTTGAAWVLWGAVAFGLWGLLLQ